ncbi:MAG: hypothetical protein QM767_00755 [Anaeromyxobacter sp.]
MPSALAIAQTGLQVADMQLATSAHNVANVLTDGFEPSRVEQRELAGGGVTGTVQPASDPVAESRADQAILAPSRTDIAQEILAQQRASLAYQASAATIKVAEQATDALIEALG